MANTNTDLTEEDAADLQFPKDRDFASTSSFLPLLSSQNILDDRESSNNCCINCLGELESRFIYCNRCKLNICCVCFASGAEFLEHKSNHEYKILHSNFTLFENTDWSAEEEVKLLDSVIYYGNWNLVGQDLPNRSVKDIINHYDYFYLKRKGSSEFPKLPEREAAVFPQIVVPYKFQLSDNDDPPRYSTNSTYYPTLAGYNAARSDFENDYDANAEDLLSNLEILEESDPLYDVTTKLQLHLVQSYNRRLLERQRRKFLIKQHGLLMLRKTISWLHRYESTISRPIYEKLIRFMQYCEPESFHFLLEGLHRAGELRIQISRLMHLRKKGITTLSEGRLYLRLQQIHEENRRKLKLFRSNAKFNWKSIRDNAFPMLPKFSKRRPGYSPIDIVGMPGYEKLLEKERDLCSTIRLVPIMYLELKDVLVAENKKIGHVKLQTARRLLKIDVNKTRKLFDFLVEEGFITKPKN